MKRTALELFSPTLRYPERLGIRVLDQTAGLTAAAFDFSGLKQGDWLLTSNVETLGTKSIVADFLYQQALSEKFAIAGQLDPPGYYRGLGQDAVAMALNDQVAIGATVFAYHDIITCGRASWFASDADRTYQLLLGYRLAADKAKFAIPQGDTPELPDIVDPNRIDLVGGALGIVSPRSRLLDGSRIRTRDVLVGLESSGPHANGITKIRRIASHLADNYLTTLSDGRSLGDAVLEPTRLYAEVVEAMFAADIDIHFLQPITGHGWAKIARAPREFSYIIEYVPQPPPLFRSLVEWSARLGFDASDRENYYTWNMGVGMVAIVPARSADTTVEIASRCGIGAAVVGEVRQGARQVQMPFREGATQVTYALQ